MSKKKSVVLSKSLNSGPIEIFSSFKTLGVFLFNENVTWDCHINCFIPKLSRVIGIVNRNRRLLPRNVKLLIYRSLFHSRLTYCHLLWGSSTLTIIETLFLLHKYILSIVCNVLCDADTAEYLETLR